MRNTNGLLVVVEKPFAPSTRECNSMIDLANAKSKILAVFQNRRWDADYATLQKIILDGKIGRVLEFESHFDRYSLDSHTDWAAVETPGAGVLYDLGTHLIDQILNIFGLPQSVTGFLSVQRESFSGPVDSCTVLLHYRSGLLATVKASALSAEAAQLRFWARGDRGSYKKVRVLPELHIKPLTLQQYHLDPQEPQLASGMQAGDPQFGKEDAGKEGKLWCQLTDSIINISQVF